MDQVYKRETKQEKKKRYQLKFIEEERRKYFEQKLRDALELERSGKALAAWRNKTHM
jgi:hypothetical protein